MQSRKCDSVQKELPGTFYELLNMQRRRRSYYSKWKKVVLLLIKPGLGEIHQRSKVGQEHEADTTSGTARVLTSPSFFGPRKPSTSRKKRSRLKSCKVWLGGKKRLSRSTTHVHITHGRGYQIECIKTSILNEISITVELLLSAEEDDCIRRVNIALSHKAPVKVDLVIYISGKRTRGFAKK